MLLMIIVQTVLKDQVKLLIIRVVLKDQMMSMILLLMKVMILLEA